MCCPSLASVLGQYGWHGVLRFRLPDIGEHGKVLWRNMRNRHDSRGRCRRSIPHEMNPLAGLGGLSTPRTPRLVFDGSDGGGSEGVGAWAMDEGILGRSG